MQAAVRVTFVGQNQLVALQLRHDAVARDYDVRICARWNTAGCPDNKRLRHMQTDLVAQRGRIGFVALIRRAISKRLVHRTIRTIDGAARNLIGPVELSIGRRKEIAAHGECWRSTRSQMWSGRAGTTANQH